MIKVLSFLSMKIASRATPEGLGPRFEHHWPTVSNQSQWQIGANHLFWAPRFFLSQEKIQCRYK